MKAARLDEVHLAEIDQGESKALVHLRQTTFP